MSRNERRDPASGVATVWTFADERSRLLSRSECESLAGRIASLPEGGGSTRVLILNWWNGELRWARNRISLRSDRRSGFVWIERTVRGAKGSALTNQLDTPSLEAAIREAERIAVFGNTSDERFDVAVPPFEYPRTTVWSDRTYALTPAERSGIALGVIEPAERAGMISAGYLEARAQSGALIQCENRQANTLYATVTQGQCSMTVRTLDGTGSGWAGMSSYDWSRIDGPSLARKALEKCLMSRNPVRIEPGRYTTILEPQAVHDLVTIVVDALGRVTPELYGMGPFVLGYDSAIGMWRTKLGLQIIDHRISISHDPEDPQLGVLPVVTDPFTGSLGEPYRKVTWIDQGILASMAHGRQYALTSRNENMGVPNSGSFRMSGGNASIEEMIRSTQRGLVVTRFSNLSVLDGVTLLATGTTRDGLWLVEGGKITKAVMNMRITESPLFALNQVESLGIPEPVFKPVRHPILPGITPAIVPSLKINDFSFTATSDAI